jgi:F0F1-type ATP synthase assembly protein I
MRKLIVLVEALALAAGIVIVAVVNPQTGQMMVAASQAANGPHESFMIIAFAHAAGTVAVLTVHPQSPKPWPQ